MKKTETPCTWLFAAAITLFALGAYADPHVTAKPEDYRLKSDLELSTGQIVPKGTAWYAAPDIKRLKKELASGKYNGDIAKAQLIDFGYELVYNTYNTIGAGRKDNRPPLAQGKVINCTNCHIQGGTVPFAWPYFRTITFFGLREQGDTGVFFGNLGYHRDARTRARDCGLECGGTINIAEDSYEMDALIAWMTVVRDGIYPGEGLLIPEFKTKKDVAKIPGAQIPLFAGLLDMKANPQTGEKVYAQRCLTCHGDNGLGFWRDGEGYIIPAVAGSSSFSHAGGPLMVPIGAAFLQRNMPLSQGASLPPQEALDVMAYIATLPRDTVWWQSYYFQHDPCSRPAFMPLHVGVVPKNFPFAKEQAQFGPWRPIAEWLASDACKAANPPTQPLLTKDFDPKHAPQAPAAKEPTSAPQ